MYELFVFGCVVYTLASIVLGVLKAIDRVMER